MNVDRQTARELVLEQAALHVGMREATGNNDGIPAQVFNRGDRVPWCASFCLTVFSRAGFEVPGGYYQMRFVETFETTMQRMGLWLGWKVIPEPADVIFFGVRGASDAGKGRHMGIVERVDLDKQRVHTIEGNVSNAVKRQSHWLRDPHITGYARIIDLYALE